MVSKESKTQRSTFKIKVVILDKPVKYRGDVNDLVSEYFDKEITHGIILHHTLPKNIFKSLINMMKRIRYINWIYISDSKSEVCLFTMNYRGFKKNYNIEDLKKNLSEILSTDIEDVFIYPIKNILNTLNPKPVKDVVFKKKPAWDWGRLGKKEYRRKFTRMRKKILYDNLKR